MASKLPLIGGILCLLGSFVFSWYGSIYVASGLGLINIGDTIDYLISSGTPNLWVGFIVGIITIISGIFILIGRKSKAILIIFGLIPFIQMLFTILTLYSIEVPVVSEYLVYSTELFWFHQLGDIFPFVVNLGDAGLGCFLLCGGGLLSIIAGIKQK